MATLPPSDSPIAPDARTGGAGLIAKQELGLRIALIAAIYLGLELAGTLLVSPRDVSPLSPAPGLALAALLVCGGRCWPGVWLGAFSFHVLPDLSFTGAAAAALLAAGATLQALLGARLTRRFVDAPLPLAREGDVWRFLLAGGPLACLVAPSLGMATLYGFGRLPSADVGLQWLTWWAGDAAAVLLFAPLALVAWPRAPTRRTLGGRWIALPLLITTGLLVAGHLALNRLEQASARQEMEHVHDEGFLSLLAFIERLRGVERFLAASDTVTEREFATYTALLTLDPAVLAVDWAPRVPRAERKAFEAARRREGTTDYRFLDLDPDGRPVPAAERAEHFPVVFTEPLSRNEAVLGLDHGFDASRAAAMARARDSGEAVAASIGPLLRTSQRATLVFMPVYRWDFARGMATVEWRREALRGFVVGAFDLDLLFAPLAREARARQLALRVADVTPGGPARVLADTLQTGVVPSWSRQIGFAGRVWRLEMQPAAGYRQAGASPQARLYLGASVLAAFVAAFAALGAAARSAVTSREVAERTADLERELRARRTAEAALRDAMQDLDITLRSIGDAVLATDAQGRITRMNPIAEKLTGWPLAEAHGRPVDEVFRIINEATRLPGVIPVDEVLRTGEIHGLANHTALIARDGSEHAIADSAAPIRDAEGVVRGVVLVFQDVTQERVAERALRESEARYRQFIDLSPFGVLVHCAGQLVFLNPKAVALLGADNDRQLIGRSVLNFLHPDSREAARQRLHRVNLEGIAVPAREAKWLRLDGSIFHGESTAVPYEHQGQPGALVLLQDVTARKEAEEQLGRFFTVSLDMLCIASSDGYFKRINPAFTETLGWSVEEILARPFLDFVHPDDHSATLREVEKQVATGEKVLRFENRYRHKDGSWRWLSWRSVPQPGGFMFAVARDITRQHEADEQLSAANRQLEQAKSDAEQASRAKSAFLATMSHEIRTPMNGVIGMADVLAHSHLSEHQTELVNTIRESATALLRIIDDILDFSKIEAGRLEIDRAPVCVTDLVEGLCNSLVPVAARRAVDLSLFVSPEIPERVLSDDMRLRQVLYNLVGNAIKFSGGRPQQRGRVSVRVEVAGTAPLRLAFTVSDDGIGMAPETLDNLFTPFAQADITTTRRFGGTGLGLAICKRLVDLMQGEMAVTSRIGEGSIFTVSVPFEVAAEQPARILPDLSGLHCIVVESTGFNANDLAIYLEHAGAQVHLAADAAAAAQVAVSLTAPVVAIQGSVRERREAALNEALASLPNLRRLLISRGRRRRARLDTPDTVSLDGDALRRQAFLRAVAVAAGRASPEILHPRAAEELPGALARPPSIAKARAQGTLILVAEDDEINQKVILQQLGLLGYAAEIAGNGREALRMWRAGHYALLLTDLHMPEMDGYTLADTIRREEAGGTRMPILALTANALRGEANRARAAGMDEYLTKPVQLQLLQAALQQWLPRASGETGSGTRPEEPSGGHAECVVDVGVLQGLVGDEPATVREFLCDYLASAKHLSSELRTACAMGNTHEVAAIAHKLKSSSRAVGAIELGDRCAELENAGKAGNRASIAQSMTRFEAALAGVEAEIAGLTAGA
jgi:PAS domain S-box-containing protein